MPSGGFSGGSDAGKGSVTNENADDHFSYVRWDDAVLPAMQTITPTSPGERVETPDELLERTLKISKWNPGLTMLYFHTPHEGLEKAKLVGAAAATLRQCKTFRDENVSRWLGVYHCVEVDMSKSDLRTAERLGFKDGAIFSVIDQSMNVIATSKSVATSDGVTAFLKAAVKSEKAAKQWALIQARIDDQKKALEKGRALAAQEKWKEAREQYDLVLNTDTRVADFFDEARKEAAKVYRKADQEK